MEVVVATTIRGLKNSVLPNASIRRLVALTVLVAAGSLAIAVANAQQDVAALQVEKVKEGLYIITGGRGSGAQAGGIAGNSTVFVTTAGVVLIDTKYPGFGTKILDQIKTVTNKPVTMVINTHTHGDHTGGNPELPKNLEFVAQENTRANMARMDEFKGDSAAWLPKRTFKDSLSLFGGNDRIELHYFGAGHTNGDAVIVFPALRTAVMGDLFARKWAPLVDANNGGSAVAFPKTLASALANLKNVETLITGHSTTTLGSGAEVKFVRSNPVMKLDDLREYAAFMRDFVAAAEAAMKAGKTVDEAVSGLKLPDQYRNYDMRNAKADVQRVYDELKR
jgi:glyoxylase-like metal-dependent hydrolase (beta-lactamase superfamily II)